MDRLKGKVAIITGGASGQGAAEARLFAAEGARVVITDLNEEDGKGLAEAIGGAAIFVVHDVADASSWDGAVSAALGAFGKVNILVNSAGIYAAGRYQDTDAATLERFYRINVLGTFLGMKAVHPAMLDAGGGSIVNISSAAALRGFANAFAYATSKWMVRGMSKCAAIDLAESNIRVNTILPGTIDTPMLAENPPEALAAWAQMIPAKRIGTSNDVANVALFLASDEASYIMGAEITVCGGIAA